MASYGGDITEIRYNNSEVGSGVFYPVSGQAGTLDPGGLRNTDDAAAMSGDGQLVITKNRVRGSLEIVCANDMNIRNDIEVYKALHQSTVITDWTISINNGTIWGGSGVPVGDLAADVNAATFPLKVAAGEFKKIQ